MSAPLVTYRPVNRYTATIVLAIITVTTISVFLSNLNNAVIILMVITNLVSIVLAYYYYNEVVVAINDKDVVYSKPFSHKFRCSYRDIGELKLVYSGEGYPILVIKTKDKKTSMVIKGGFSENLLSEIKRNIEAHLSELLPA